jgi:7,8-dihydro-6-hydroxymethylpterin-pyrophosphokinase
MKLTIADCLKYAQDLEKRLDSIQGKIKQVEMVKITQKVISANSASATNVVEQAEYTLNPKSLYAEYDETAKELRLVRQAIERANHSIELDIIPKF